MYFFIDRNYSTSSDGWNMIRVIDNYTIVAAKNELIIKKLR